MIFEKLTEDMKTAMKSGDALSRDCIRSIISDIKNQTVNAGKELNDSVCIAVLKKAAKAREESISQFSAAGREDLAAKEKAEKEIVSRYLPKQMSTEETKQKVEAVVAESGIEPVKKNMGAFMKKLAEYKDSMDMKTASSLLSKILK